MPLDSPATPHAVDESRSCNAERLAPALEAVFPAPARLRRIVFGLALAGYVLSYFHRTAPAAIADQLTHAYGIGGAVLGTVAATYFYVYTLLQVPAGVLADTLGPRRVLTAGSAIAAVGSLLFALAPVWEVAAIGRTLVGVGVSVSFIATLKLCASWFAPERFASLAGVTMFAGNLGAVVAGAPLAWIVTQASWRTVFVVLSVLSALLAVATWWRVRDRPGEVDDSVKHATPGRSTNVPWTRAVLHVVGNRATWPAFMVNVGVGGSFFAFAGLWAVPFLQQAYGLSRVQAAQHTSLLLLGVAIGSLCIGMISDCLGSRLGVMRAAVALYALSWTPWLVHVDWPVWATLAWFFVMGLLIPGFTLSWTIAKEANPPEFSGIATSVVNVGIFLGTGVLQPLVGWVLDRSGHGVVPHAWDGGIALLAGAAWFGAVMTLAPSHRPRDRCTIAT